VKPANKAVPTDAELVERRTGAEGKASQQSAHRAQDRESVSQALERIRNAARQRKEEKFPSLAHHISIAMLRTAFFELKRDAAPGGDGLTWQTYEADLDRNLTDLHSRGFIGEPTGRCPAAVSTYQRRMADSGRLRLRWGLHNAPHAK